MKQKDIDLLMESLYELQGITESVLDFTHTELNTKIWGEDKRLRPEVKDEILSIFYDWLKTKFPNTDPEKIYFVGSNATYQYSDNSDIDITIQLPVAEEQLVEVIHELPNGNLLSGTECPINFFLRPDADIVLQLTDGVYDILNDKWVKLPQSNTEKTEYPQVIEIAKFFMDGIDLREQEYKRDTIELNIYEKALQEQDLATDPKVLEDMIELKRKEIRADIDALYVAFHVVHNFRGEAFQPGYDEDYLSGAKSTRPNMTINNQVYKVLERFGYLDRLHSFLKIRKEMMEKESNFEQKE